MFCFYFSQAYHLACFSHRFSLFGTKCVDYLCLQIELYATKQKSTSDGRKRLTVE